MIGDRDYMSIEEAAFAIIYYLDKSKAIFPVYPKDFEILKSLDYTAELH